MTDPDVVRLRDYFERLLHEQERRYELRLDQMDKALTLQAKEYERRLNSLNHEAARILAAAEKSVSLEKFEGFERRYLDYVSATSRALNLKQGSDRGVSTAWAAVVSGFAIVGVVVSVVLALTQ